MTIPKFYCIIFLQQISEKKKLSVDNDNSCDSAANAFINGSSSRRKMSFSRDVGRKTITSVRYTRFSYDFFGKISVKTYVGRFSGVGRHHWTARVIFSKTVDVG